MKATSDRKFRRFRRWFIAMVVLVSIGIPVPQLHAGPENLGTMDRMFKKGTPPTGITVRTKTGAEKDIVDTLQRGMTASQISNLLGRPEKVFVPSGRTGPPVLPMEWADAEEEWWIYPNRKTKDGLHLYVLFANRSGGKKTLFSVWLWPSQKDPQQAGRGDGDKPAN